MSTWVFVCGSQSKKRRRQQGSCVFQLPKRKGKPVRLFRMGSGGRRGFNTTDQLIRTRTVEIQNPRARELSHHVNYLLDKHRDIYQSIDSRCPDFVTIFYEIDVVNFGRAMV